MNVKYKIYKQYKKISNLRTKMNDIYMIYDNIIFQMLLDR